VSPSIALSAVEKAEFALDWNAGKFDPINWMVPVGEALGAPVGAMNGNHTNTRGRF
jgi:hypothetical protein